MTHTRHRHTPVASTSILLSPTSIHALIRQQDEQQIPESVRVLQIAANSGAAIEAYLAWTGAHPHNGITLDDVYTHLANTALAALTAIGSLGGDPNTVITKHLTDIAPNVPYRKAP